MTDVPTGRTGQAARSERYDIHVSGHLAPRWVAFFDGMTVTPMDDGTTVIGGPVADQSALHGLLRKVGDLGLRIVSVEPAAVEALPDRT